MCHKPTLRYSSAREFQMGNFQKYWSQNVGQDFLFIVLDFFVGGRSWGRKRCVREINVSCAWDPVHAGDKALTRETPTKRGRVKRYANCKLKSRLNLPSNLTLNFEFPFLINLFAYLDTVPRLAPYTFMNTYCQIN